mgnify:CR=1 FL=1
MAELLRAWKLHVTRFVDEASKPPSDIAWGAHDLVAALILRDFIAEGIARVPSKVATRIQLELAAADANYLSFSEPDHAGVLRSFADLPQREGYWWWDRLPSRGMARDEIMTWTKPGQ